MDVLYAALAVGVILMLVRLIFRSSKKDDTYSDDLLKISEDVHSPIENEIPDDDDDEEVKNEDVIENDDEIINDTRENEPTAINNSENTDTDIPEKSENNEQTQHDKNIIIVNALEESIKLLRKEISAAEKEKAQEELEIEDVESKICGDDSETDKALVNLANARRNKIASIEKTISEKRSSMAVLENEIAEMTGNGADA